MLQHSIENTDGITLENETSLANNLLLDVSKIIRKNSIRRCDKIIYDIRMEFTIGET